MPADDPDYYALWLEERAQVKKLTDALIALKQQGMSPGVEPRPPKPPGESTVARLSPLVQRNLKNLESEVASHMPDGTPAELIHAEAVRLALETFPDA